MKLALALFVVSQLAVLAPAMADDQPTMTVSIQTGFTKCVPSSGSTTCGTVMNAPQNVVLALDTANQGQFSAEDQTFAYVVSLASEHTNSGNGYGLTISFENTIDRSLHYSMGQVIDPQIAVTMTDKPIFVQRSQYEADSYQPILMIGPALAGSSTSNP